jgi:RHS repeat-associated protein
MSYIYDASGRKLNQSVFNMAGDLQKSTDYNGDLFYENDTLKFINHDEGRIIMTGATPEYQYHLKDHLGNVRMTFTTKREVETSIGTFEPSNENTERESYLRYDNIKRIQSYLFDRTNGTAPTTMPGYAIRLNGTTNEVYGAARSLSVMAGDTIKLEVWAKYIDTNEANWTETFSNLMAVIASPSAPAGTSIDGIDYSSSTSSFMWPGKPNNTNSSGTGPKAFINWIIFDKKFNVLNGGYKRISGTPKEYGQDVSHEKLSGQVVVKEPGYVYIYFSNENETPVEVYFDDFKVEHIKSPVIQTDEYYPFGLTFNSYQRENTKRNRILFQGQEHVDDLDLDWDSFKWRNHQPDLGRFFNVDPLAESFCHNSPYAFSENKVTNHIELEGLEAYPAQRALNREIKKVENVVMPVVNKVADGVTSVVNTIGDGIASVWNSISPGNDRGGNIWTTKEHSGGDQRDVPDGQADGGGNVDPLIAPTLRTDPAGKVIEGAAQGVEMATFIESKTHVIENVVKETGGENATVKVKEVKDTISDSKNFIKYKVTTTNGKDSTIQVSKQDDQKK